METKPDVIKELPVTFHPPLYLQRRGWVLDCMRRDAVAEVLDIGCCEGELLSCLCNPAPWLPPLPPMQDDTPAATMADAWPLGPSSSGNKVCMDVLAELHRDILHATKIAGLDISLPDLECTVEITQPPPSEPKNSSRAWSTAPVRWEPLDVDVWQGSLAHVNPAFVGVECIVATEVIEHLHTDVLDRFAPVVLGAYHPRLLLITTPSFTFNARFTAPDAPPEARSGWRDPTGRTERVFRHHDHKFEWTPGEFEEWCRGVADTWGYDVEIGGVGRAKEVDEWGRDEALGWASQVAAFRRREGGEWVERRLWQSQQLGEATAGGSETQQHRLVATHHHPAHVSARTPRPLDAIGDLVVSRMVYYRETTMPLTEMWFEHEVGLTCGGWVDLFVRAIHAHKGLALEKRTLMSGASGEWVIQLDPAFHHLLLLEPRVGPWVSPPDSDEVSDPCDADMVDAWGDNGDNVMVRGSQENLGTVGCWGEIGQGDWGAPEGGWGAPKEELDWTPESERFREGVSRQ